MFYGFYQIPENSNYRTDKERFQQGLDMALQQHYFSHYYFHSENGFLKDFRSVLCFQHIHHLPGEDALKAGVLQVWPRHLEMILSQKWSVWSPLKAFLHYAGEYIRKSAALIIAVSSRAPPHCDEQTSSLPVLQLGSETWIQLGETGLRHGADWAELYRLKANQ